MPEELDNGEKREVLAALSERAVQLDREVTLARSASIRRGREEELRDTRNALHKLKNRWLTAGDGASPGRSKQDD